MPLFLHESASFARYPQENAQHQRIARAWNRIHQQLLENPQAITTSPIGNSIFFIFDDQLLICSDFWEKDLETGFLFDHCSALYEFDGQSVDMLDSLARKMEAWLENPTCIERKESYDLLAADLDERRDFEGIYEAKYLYLVDA